LENAAAAPFVVDAYARAESFADLVILNELELSLSEDIRPLGTDCGFRIIHALHLP
jgi:hypothetical protein